MAKQTRHVVTFGSRDTFAGDQVLLMPAGFNPDLINSTPAELLLLGAVPYTGTRPLTCQIVTPPTLITYVVEELYTRQPVYVAPLPVLRSAQGRLEVSNCSFKRGWVDNGTDSSGFVRIVDRSSGVEIGRVTASKARPDVAQALTTSFQIMGFEIDIDQATRTVEQDWDFFVGNTDTKLSFESGVPSTPSGCGGTDPELPPVVYVQQTRLDGPGQVLEAATPAKRYFLTERLSDGSERPRTATSPAVSFALLGETLPGAVLTPGVNDCLVSLNADSITADTTRTLRASFAGGGFADISIQFINFGCVRPNVTYINPTLIWNSGGTPFTSLDDAIAKGTALFAPGSTTLYGNFRAQMVNYNVGTTCYVGVPPINDCVTVDARFFYVADGNGNNTQLLAIQTDASGKIIASKAVSAPVVQPNVITEVQYRVFNFPGATTGQRANQVEIRISRNNTTVATQALWRIQHNNGEGDIVLGYFDSAAITGEDGTAYYGHGAALTSTQTTIIWRIRTKGTTTDVANFTINLTGATIPWTTIYPTT